ncbi:MAG: ATP-binding cassette domain-containing protein [Gammaproteobacteria bacterium]|nr:ATP-binding cassette domain-containing protein [Gammaproteobacteria bacterium]
MLSVDSVAVEFSMSGDGWLSAPSVLRAVDDVSLTVKAGETLGIVGESGCGKSTLARAMMNLVTATSGRVCLLGQQLPELDRQALRKARRDIQIIFQDPLASLNPRMTIGNIIAEPLETFMPSLTARQRRERVAEMLMTVGLDVSYINRYPHEFSGGQCQRIGIARALIAEPQVVICDEPVSALDVTVQAQIIELLTGLQQRLGLTLIFIAHDLAVVQQISHRIAVMYLGRIVELADSAALFARPQHPYTRALIEAVPVPDPRIEKHRIRRTLDGEVPSPLNIPDGCAFRSRCRHAIAECAQARPLLQSCADSEVACHLAGQID